MRLALAMAAMLLGVRAAAQPAAGSAPPDDAPAGAVVAPRPSAAPKSATTPAVAAASGLTPNNQRVVSIGALDKRTGLAKTYAGNPGQMFSFGTLKVTVRACETTPPWEQKLTGAFLLIDETNGNAAPRRVYSGWMFGESPSLHPLEHARYDIWVKSCEMRFPDTGPNTVAAGKVGGDADADKPKASKAKKSAVLPSAVAN